MRTLRAIVGILATLAVLATGVGCADTAVRFEGPPGAIYTFEDAPEAAQPVPFTRTYRLTQIEYGRAEAFSAQLPDGRWLFGHVEIRVDRNTRTALGEYTLPTPTEQEIQEIFATGAPLGLATRREDGKVIVGVSYGPRPSTLPTGPQ